MLEFTLGKVEARIAPGFERTKFEPPLGAGISLVLVLGVASKIYQFAAPSTTKLRSRGHDELKNVIANFPIFLLNLGGT